MELNNVSSRGSLLSGAKLQELQGIATRLGKESAEREAEYRKAQEDRINLETKYHEAVLRFTLTQNAPQYLLDAVDEFFDL